MPDPAPNALHRLRAALEALFGKPAPKQPTAEAVMAVKRDFARAMPGADPVAAEDLDRLLEQVRTQQIAWGFDRFWIWGVKGVECRAAIRALPPDRRAALFRHLLALKAHLGWDAHDKDLHGERFTPSKNYFESFCEGAMIGLTETGFPVDAALAVQTLDWLARQCPLGYDLATIGSYRPTRALGAARGIAKAVARGVALPESARRDALLIFDRWLNLDAAAREALLSKGQTLEPAQKALLEIAGCARQDTFFRRMRALPAPRADLRCGVVPDEMQWRLIREWYAEFRALVTEVKRCFAGGSAAPGWLDDEALFRAAFDVTDAEMEAPWWIEKARPGTAARQPGFAAPRNTPAIERLADPAFRPYTDAELEALRRFAIRMEETTPFVFDGKAPPDIEAFVFEGADPEGLFLEHLVSLDASQPSPKWLKATDSHVARIGAARVLRGFERWLSHLEAGGLDGVDWVAGVRAQSFFPSLPNVGDELGRSSRERSLTLRRSALAQMATRSLALGEWPRPKDLVNHRRRRVEDALRRPLSEASAAVARGLVWALSRIDDPRAPALLESAGRDLYAKGFGGFRCKIAGNAVLWSLGQIGTLDAARALARLRRGVRDKSVARLVDSALEAAGARAGLGLDDMRDLATPDCGLGPDGTRTETLGNHVVTLAVVSSRKARLTHLDASDPKAKPRRGLPRAALADAATSASAAELAQAQADIEWLLPEARARLQNAWRGDRHWRLADWRERFLDNGLVATLTRRLIWRFETEAGAVEAMPRADGTMLLADGATTPLPGPQAQVRLWHPLGARSEAIAAWRKRLKAIGVRQPFAQAWRVNFALTTAERETGAYSNRFAGHILHQPPLIAILRKRGWIAASRIAFDPRSDARPNRLALPAFGVAAEFWFSGVGAANGPGPHEYGALNYEYVTTDRLVFHALDARTGALSAAPLPLDAVPPMAFSETLCDLETVIDATSIAADRFWSDRGAGAARPVSELPDAALYRNAFAAANRGESQALRKAFLETLLPSLAVAGRCHIEGDWLMVDGTRATYRIHLGSGASQWADTARHLCIVPTSSEEDLALLPFEGDTTLSLILAKAMLLAQDDRIDDPSILSQLGT